MDEISFSLFTVNSTVDRELRLAEPAVRIIRSGLSGDWRHGVLRDKISSSCPAAKSAHQAISKTQLHGLLQVTQSPTQCLRPVFRPKQCVVPSTQPFKSSWYLYVPHASVIQKLCSLTTECGFFPVYFSE
jgi:hypothetical protein